MKNIPAHIFTLFRGGFLLFFIAINLLFISPVMALAATSLPTTPTPTCSQTDLGCLPDDPIQFVTKFYSIGLGLIGGVALLFIIIGSYTIMTSRGNPDQVNVGKSYIFYAILGLLLAIFGYLFIEVFLVDILHIPGFGH